MPHKIYVGNYPMNFVEDDVINLFQDYEGVELVGFFKNNNKCYSFLHCISQHQLMEIVVNLDSIDVCGRNLIVRAADEKLQKRIQQSISKQDAYHYHPKNTSASSYRNNGVSDHSEATSSKQSSSPQLGTSYGEKNEMGFNADRSTIPNRYNNTKRIPMKNEDNSKSFESCDYSLPPSKSNYPSGYNSQNSACGGRKNISNRFGNHDQSHSSESNYFSPQNIHYSQNSFSADKEKDPSNFDRNLGESEKIKLDPRFNPQETFSRISKSKTNASGHYKTINERFDFYKKNLMHNKGDTASAVHQANDSGKEYQKRTRNVSESSVDTVHPQPCSQDYENLSYISVINFPLNLPTRDLYTLFADFNPVKVFIVCNEPRVDRAPTEAIICFESEKEATDAMLSLDNTIYRGRVLIVADTVDMSLVSELLSFH